MEIRKTRQRWQTLELLAAHKVTHGFEIAREAMLKLGTVYGILMAFEEQGMVESRWEVETPAGRPRRKLYRLTDSGLGLLADYREHFQAETTTGGVRGELHKAINQVWGGIFAVGVRRERERQVEAGMEISPKPRFRYKG